MQLRSDAVRCGTARAPHRSLLKADGITDEEMERPLVAVFNSRNDIIPGHNNLDKIAEAVKAGIYMAGGVPFEISTIGVCDGIAMNHDGMHYSLVSREAIADSLECAVQGHAFDALVCIPNCDKIVPGMLLGALRVNIPTVFVSGGPMLPGKQPGGCGPTTDLNTLFDGAAQVMNGDMSEAELKYYEDTACPTCGSCSGMFAANSMNCLCEALGIALPGNGTVPAVYSERIRLAKHAGMKVMELLEKGICARDIVSAAALHNAMECDMAFGGSTNTVLHLTAIAREAGHPITMDDWDAASARTPHLVKLQPSGPRPLSDLYEVGGVPVVMHELAELDLLDRSAVTCMGTLDEYLQACTKPADGEVCRAHDNPFSPSGALKVLHGNIAPDGAIVKKSAVDPSMLVHTGPARCFDSEEEACAAINAGKIAAGDVVVIRYEGPKGGPGMREMLTPTSSIVGMGLPTTANYIIMASLTAPILVQLASGIVVHGVALAVPLIAAHLYCFYFGILADDTPPVGLAAYAAAAIADTSPIATGIQGFLYDIRTAILPLMFIFNHDIILWGIDSVPEGIFLFFMTVLGCMSFASLTQGWFIAKNTLPDALLLACSTIIMLYPALLTGFFLPHDQRYWGYLIGIGIMGLLAYMQHARTTQTTEAAA